MSMPNYSDMEEGSSEFNVSKELGNLAYRKPIERTFLSCPNMDSNMRTFLGVL